MEAIPNQNGHSVPKSYCHISNFTVHSMVAYGQMAVTSCPSSSDVLGYFHNVANHCSVSWVDDSPHCIRFLSRTFQDVEKMYSWS